jgi:hypothetical protein
MYNLNHSSPDFLLNKEMKAILDERLKENESTYLSSEESIKRIEERLIFHNKRNPKNRPY